LATLQLLFGMQHAPTENGVHVLLEQEFSVVDHLPLRAKHAVSFRLPQSPSGVQQALVGSGQLNKSQVWPVAPNAPPCAAHWLAVLSSLHTPLTQQAPFKSQSTLRQEETPMAGVPFPMAHCVAEMNSHGPSLVQHATKSFASQFVAEQSVAAPANAPCFSSVHAWAVAVSQFPSSVQHAPMGGAQVVFAQSNGKLFHWPWVLAHAVSVRSAHAPSGKQHARADGQMAVALPNSSMVSHAAWAPLWLPPSWRHVSGVIGEHVPLSRQQAPLSGVCAHCTEEHCDLSPMKKPPTDSHPCWLKDLQLPSFKQQAPEIESQVSGPQVVAPCESGVPPTPRHSASVNSVQRPFSRQQATDGMPQLPGLQSLPSS